MNHHAVLIKKTGITVPEALSLYGRTEDYEVYILPFSKVGIEEVRQIITEASVRPQKGLARLLVINIESITHYAEQALLKILEEPPVSALFLVVVSNGINFIPTLQSRLQEMTVEQVSAPQFSDFLSFKEATVAKRLEIIDEKISKKETFWIENIKSGLKQFLENRDKLEVKSLSDYELVLTNLNTTGAANKMLLEYLAIKLP